MSHPRRNETLLDHDELPVLKKRDSLNLSLADTLRSLINDGHQPDPETGSKESRLEFVFVTGPHASGKSALARLAFREMNGIGMFDTGPILRSYRHYDTPSEHFGEWVERNENDYGDYFTDDLLSSHISLFVATNKTPIKQAIVIGNRSLQGIWRLQHIQQPVHSKVVYVDADPSTLYQRYVDREGVKGFTRHSFDALLEHDKAMGLADISAVADIIVINENSPDSAAKALRNYIVND